MQEWDKYKSVKIERGELVDRIKNTTQKEWIHVCEKLGIFVSTSFGHGSHAAAFKPNCPPENRACCIVTLVKNMYPNIQRDVFKKVLCYGLESKTFSEDDIWKALGVL